MAKKRVPDWLNSPLWSVSPNDDHLRYSSATTYSQTEDTVVHPPASVSPPASDRSMPPQATARHETTNSRSSNGHDDINGSNDPNGIPSRDPEEDISVQAQILTELSKKVINMRELRRIALQGVPDGAGIRSKVWKLLLGYLPSDRALWSSELAKKRSQYKHLKEDLLMNPSEMIQRVEKSTACKNDGFISDSRVFLSRSEVFHGEHPLSLVKTSMWNKFFQDMEIMEQIDRDVRRTHPDIHFFSCDSPFSKSNQEALKNILVVFARLNPGIRYVQGMNEVLAPIFYVLRTDLNEEMAAGAEADTFFCFVELLSGFRDNFCQQLDNSTEGIRSAMSRLSQLLKEHDEELWRHLEVTTKARSILSFMHLGGLHCS